MRTIAIVRDDRELTGTLQIAHGRISAIECQNCTGDIDQEARTFALAADFECRLKVSIGKHFLEPGAFATMVTLSTVDDGFSFFLRDVSKEYPVYVPEYKTIVTDAGDKRSFKEIVQDIDSRNRRSKLEEYACAEEESFASAAVETRELKCVTWLGISRDIRVFEIGTRLTSGTTDPWDWIKPRFHKREVTVPELGEDGIVYNYFAGRGLGCIQGLERRLEDGVLPILDTTHADEDVIYASKMFVTLEKDVLSEDRVQGTNILVADHYSEASMLTADQQADMEKIHDREIFKDEETVIYIKINATNTADAPKYSWVRIPEANVYVNPGKSRLSSSYDMTKGYGSFGDERVYLVATLNGKPVPQQEMAVLLAPGESIEYLFKIPHRPVSTERAGALAGQDYRRHYDACKVFWMRKLDRMASLSVPEKRIDEMMRAGKLQFGPCLLWQRTGCRGSSRRRRLQSHRFGELTHYSIPGFGGRPRPGKKGDNVLHRKAARRWIHAEFWQLHAGNRGCALEYW